MAEEIQDVRQSERLTLSATQIVASVLAAISASLAASYFGVAGTMIGAALGSAVSVVGSAIYAHSIAKTRERLRGGALDTAVEQRFNARPKRMVNWRPKQLAIAVSALFLIAVGTVTGLELFTGKPISATVGGSAQTGTSLFGSAPVRTNPSMNSTAPSTPQPVGSSTLAPTRTVTVTRTPSATPAATPAPTTSAPSITPAPSVTPTVTASPSPSGSAS